jgi:hypothetical protein
MSRQAFEKWACTVNKVPTAWEAWQAALQHPQPAVPEVNQQLVEALENIANPLSYLRRKAEKDGGKLNGHAIHIANDPEFLKSIARKALIASPVKESLTTAPQPAVPDEAEPLPSNHSSWDAGFNEGWNACRDEMLSPGNPCR